MILPPKIGPPNDALKLPKRGTLSVGALRAPSSLSRASQLSAVLCGYDSVDVRELERFRWDGC